MARIARLNYGVIAIIAKMGPLAQTARKHAHVPPITTAAFANFQATRPRDVRCRAAATVFVRAPPIPPVLLPIGIPAAHAILPLRISTMEIVAATQRFLPRALVETINANTAVLAWTSWVDTFANVELGFMVFIARIM